MQRRRVPSTEWACSVRTCGYRLIDTRGGCGHIRAPARVPIIADRRLGRSGDRRACSNTLEGRDNEGRADNVVLLRPAVDLVDPDRVVMGQMLGSRRRSRGLHRHRGRQDRAGCTAIINDASRPADDRLKAYINRSRLLASRSKLDAANADAEAALQLNPLIGSGIAGARLHAAAVRQF